MTKDEALKLSLEALENIKNDPFKFDLKNNIDQAIAAIKEALAQPEQDGKCKYCTDGCPACDARKLPPQRTWVGLTDEDFYGQSELQVMAMKYAEAKLKEKNHG
jgi:hypothetical protein